jgi:hypothetical protein
MPMRSVCIHGHFYQPPREDPITGAVPNERGAAPYKNWNERIHAECYKPNAELGNFERISFNVGPTLISWLDSFDSTTYRRILDQDRANFQKYELGNAIAQAYNHTILPLAPSHDKLLQIAWGIADFEHRFGRRPQGMWLPETAVDYETLAILANQGIEFTILAPWQAVEEGLDPTESYRVNLSGSSITVFFYHQQLSSQISFNPGITANADQFVKKELSNYFLDVKERHGESQLLLLATDGELYGHHQPFRDRFLSHLVNGACAQAGIQPVFPALWLRDNPPRKTVEIRERTSWSCHHGVLRWMGECACTSNDGRWKAHLRHSFDRLAGALDALYFDNVYRFVSKPRLLRQRYIHAMLGQIPAEGLITEMAGRDLSTDQIVRIYLLLESQRERQRMFTSCGWFFDDFDRIEPRNNLAYAAQAVRLARLATGDDLTPQAISYLKHVISPHTGLRADRVFDQFLNRTWVLRDRIPAINRLRASTPRQQAPSSS